MKRLSLFLALVGLLPFGLLPRAHAATVVHVTQEDPSAGHGITRMRLVATPHRVRAGEVVFEIRNISKDLSHEVLVIKPPHRLRSMPYSRKQNRLIESRIDKLADSGDQKPGQSYTMKVDLKPGKYLLVCNKPGHYRGGMHIWLTVTR
ncbi:MAG: hypothetical protein HIU82_11615 [Proteobacteria bacterium]|nr:hypothetical protein [Pseudomonadota bacterium]